MLPLTSRKRFYVEGHAVTVVWDAYTKANPEGQTGDDMQLSPFADAVLSDYVIDELVTIPVTDNAYRKHVAQLMIFPDVPVLKGSIFQLGKSKLDSLKYDDAVQPKGYAGAIGEKRLSALIFQNDLDDLNQDIANKDAGRRQAASLIVDREYVGQGDRLPVRDVITHIITEFELKPQMSNYDFYKLCMYLYAATRDRLIDVPTKYRKGKYDMLNHQIDFYHLSYLPFVDGLVTDDRYLTMVALAVVECLGLDKEIITSKDYYSRSLRNLLSGTW